MIGFTYQGTPISSAKASTVSKSSFLSVAAGTTANQLRQHHIALFGHLQQGLRAIQLRPQMIHQLTLTGRGIGTGRDRRHPAPGVINDASHAVTAGLRCIRGATETRSGRPVSANHVVQRQHPAATGRQMRQRRRTAPARNHSPGRGNRVPAHSTPGYSTIHRPAARPHTSCEHHREPGPPGLPDRPVTCPQYVRHPPPPANTNTTLVTRRIEAPAPLVTCVNTLTAAECHDLPDRRWTDTRQGARDPPLQPAPCTTVPRRQAAFEFDAHRAHRSTCAVGTKPSFIHR